MDIRQAFRERLEEVEAYLDLLEAMDLEIQSGVMKIGTTSVSALHYHMLKSSVYLHLYNLVEATVTWCLQTVIEATVGDGESSPSRLREELRREWIRNTARTHINLQETNRLDVTCRLVDRLIYGEPIQPWELEKGGGGNWDDKSIEDIASRIGLNLQISKETYKKVKQWVRNEKGILELVRSYRNDLAHGEVSFRSCCENTTVKDLREYSNRVAEYLKEIIDQFKSFIQNGHHLSN